MKYRQGKIGTCALISEVVCRNLLAAAGLLSLDGRYVYVSSGYSASCSTKSDIPYTVVEGLHFGTILRLDVENGPPIKIGQVENPQDIVDIWVFDCWVCTIDRDLEGNTLMAYEGGKGFRVIASDQSDCFGGSESLSNGRWKNVMKVDRPAQPVSVFDQAVAQLGVESIRVAIEKVRKANQNSSQAMRSIPKLWWDVSGISPVELMKALHDRSLRLESIVDIQKWKNLGGILSKGLFLDFPRPHSSEPGT